MSEREQYLGNRVMQFQMLELPGQPRSMHMGSAYLVNDLWRSRQELMGLLREVNRAGIIINVTGSEQVDDLRRRIAALVEREDEESIIDARECD